ncbi:TOBE domain-containing protein [Phenylobacterium sp.]|jgi:molybdate transport system regulatory protein|uniref:TOBE domain-containing protein n=1 Tax=Phenylobacterium sp. TaxID=1871053 RepID=UPI002F93EBA0
MADDLSASLTFRRGAARVGLERVALLEAVAELGSISAAARRTGLSYKAAWDAVQALNNLFDTPLVAAAPGGKRGGSAAVTPKGLAVVAAFRRVRGEIDAALTKLESHVAEQPVDDLFWTLGLRTSARNALRGRVSAVREGPVSAEVTLDLAAGVQVRASLTRRSLEDLELAVGRPAIALVKASFVRLAPGDDADLRDNAIPGRVARREDGEGTSEVTIDIGGGKTLVATLGRPEGPGACPAVGELVTARIDPAQVILAVE